MEKRNAIANFLLLVLYKDKTTAIILVINNNMNHIVLDQNVGFMCASIRFSITIIHFLLFVYFIILNDKSK